ncbi:MAG: hypothetical protein R3E88_16530 [Myxococcota bacterium]
MNGLRAYPPDTLPALAPSNPPYAHNSTPNSTAAAPHIQPVRRTYPRRSSRPDPYPHSHSHTTTGHVAAISFEPSDSTHSTTAPERQRHRAPTDRDDPTSHTHSAATYSSVDRLVIRCTTYVTDCVASGCDANTRPAIQPAHAYEPASSRPDASNERDHRRTTPTTHSDARTWIPTFTNRYPHDSRPNTAWHSAKLPFATGRGVGLHRRRPLTLDHASHRSRIPGFNVMLFWSS